MLGIKFNKRSARKNLQDFDTFDALRSEILDWITLDDFQEYVEFLDNGFAAHMTEILVENNSSRAAQGNQLEQDFSARFELIRRDHCRHFIRHDAGITAREQARLLKAINKDMKAAAVDFANIIIGLYEREQPIRKQSDAPAATGHGKMDLSAFNSYVSGKGLPEHESFSVLVHEIQNYFAMPTYTAYKAFMDENGCTEAARDISCDYMNTMEGMYSLEASIFNVLSHVRKTHMRMYDRSEPLTDVKKETLRLALLDELKAVSVDLAHLVVGWDEKSQRIQRPPIRQP